MKVLILLLMLALVRPPHQGELRSQAVLTYVGGQPNLRFTFESRAREVIEFHMPVGMPLRPTGSAGEPVFLGAPLQVRLKPAERKQFTLPVVSAQKPVEGSYEPSADRSSEVQVRRVNKVLAAGQSQEVARSALLAPDQLPPEMQSRLGALQLPSLPSGSGLELTGGSRFTLEGDRLTLITPTFHNRRAPGSLSGPLRVSLWASPQSDYNGGILNGQRLGEFDLGTLAGGGVWPPFTLNLELRRPPAGRYTIIFTLEESGSGGYLITHWANFPERVDF